MKITLLIFLFLTSLFGEDKLKTAKTSCIQQSMYPNKTLAEQKKMLIEQAKIESLEELYGTLISSSTDIKDGKLVSDKIKSRAVGAVRVDGNPSFYNGKNLGEICADVNVYITKTDIKKYSPKKVSLTHYCFNDSSVAMKDIKQEAKYGAYKEMITQYKASLKLSGLEAEKLIHEFVISNDKFDFDTASYCFNAVGTLLPYELEMGVSSDKGSASYSSCNEIKKSLKKSKNGFYKITIDKQEEKVYCNMELDDNGWTRVWIADTNNYNKKNYNYLLPLKFIKKSKQTLILYENGSEVYLPYTFNTPKLWKHKHPLNYASGTTTVDTVDLDSERSYHDRTLYFGYENFSNSCHDHFKGGSWGKLCISDTKAPFYTSFAHSESDHCNTSRESYNAQKCNEKQFSIYMK